MVRLTAKAAAKKAELKKVEDEQKRLAEIEAAKEIKQVERLWKAQSKTCLRSALDGHISVAIGKKLFKPEDLLELGFDLYCMDVAAADSLPADKDEIARDYQEYLAEWESEREEELASSEKSINAAVDAFIADYRVDIGDKYCPIEQVTQDIQACIEDYKSEMREAGSSKVDLFNRFVKLKNYTQSDQLTFFGALDRVEKTVKSYIWREEENARPTLSRHEFYRSACGLDDLVDPVKVAEVLAPYEEKIRVAIDEMLEEHSAELIKDFRSKKRAIQEIVAVVEAYKAQERESEYSFDSIPDMFNRLEEYALNDEVVFETHLWLINGEVDALLEREKKLLSGDDEIFDEEYDDLQDLIEGLEHIPEELGGRAIRTVVDSRNLPLVLEVEDPRNYFLIEWSEQPDSEEWSFDQIFVAPALSWLSGEVGQSVFNCIDNCIAEAIDVGDSSIEITSSQGDDGHDLEVAGDVISGVPEASQLEILLKILDFKCEVSSTDGGTRTLKISW